MILYLVGSSCVGKSTVGSLLAERLGFTFFDLNILVEEFYQRPIERIQDECLTMHEFRRKESVVLEQVFSRNVDSVVAGTPAGLMSSYLSVYKRCKTRITSLYSIHMYDSPENILNRLIFFDKDSNPVEVEMDEHMRAWYIRDIKADYQYFKKSYARADYQINIEDIELENIPDLIIEKLRSEAVL
jgi:shikimate kinase